METKEQKIDLEWAIDKIAEKLRAYGWIDSPLYAQVMDAWNTRNPFSMQAAYNAFDALPDDEKSRIFDYSRTDDEYTPGQPPAAIAVTFTPMTGLQPPDRANRVIYLLDGVAALMEHDNFPAADDLLKIATVEARELYKRLHDAHRAWRDAMPLPF